MSQDDQESTDHRVGAPGLDTETEQYAGLIVDPQYNGELFYCIFHPTQVGVLKSEKNNNVEE